MITLFWFCFRNRQHSCIWLRILLWRMNNDLGPLLLLFLEFLCDTPTSKKISAKLYTIPQIPWTTAKTSISLDERDNNNNQAYSKNWYYNCYNNGYILRIFLISCLGYFFMRTLKYIIELRWIRINTASGQTLLQTILIVGLRIDGTLNDLILDLWLAVAYITDVGVDFRI